MKIKQSTIVIIISVILLLCILGIFIRINLKTKNSKSIISSYIGLDDFKGLELYVWKDNGDISFGLMSGTNRRKSNEEKQELKESPVSLEEIKEILDTYESGFSYLGRIDGSISDEEFQEINNTLYEYSYVSKRDSEKSYEKKEE